MPSLHKSVNKVIEHLPLEYSNKSAPFSSNEVENLIHLGVSSGRMNVFIHAISSLQILRLFIKDETRPIQRAADELIMLVMI